MLRGLLRCRPPDPTSIRIPLEAKRDSVAVPSLREAEVGPPEDLEKQVMAAETCSSGSTGGPEKRGGPEKGASASSAAKADSSSSRGPPLQPSMQPCLSRGASTVAEGSVSTAGTTANPKSCCGAAGAATAAEQHRDARRGELIEFWAEPKRAQAQEAVCEQEKTTERQMDEVVLDLLGDAVAEDPQQRGTIPQGIHVGKLEGVSHTSSAVAALAKAQALPQKARPHAAPPVATMAKANGHIPEADSHAEKPEQSQRHTHSSCKRPCHSGKSSSSKTTAASAELEKEDSGDNNSLSQPLVRCESESGTLRCERYKTGDSCGRRCFRDFAIFFLGGTAGVLAFLTSQCLGAAPVRLGGELAAGEGLAVCGAGLWRSNGEASRCSSQGVQPTAIPRGVQKPTGKFAFVQMAFDVPGKLPVHVWRVLPMARLLQSMSKFPLVVLTNTSHFPDGTRVIDAFEKLDVIVKYCHQVPLSEKWASKLPKRWLIPYWKLQIWRLVEYEKLIWVDTDTIFFRNMDWLFNYEGEWGQRDNWVCDAHEDDQNWLCSGLMLVHPNEETYQQMVRYAETGDDDWWTNGDQKLIRNFFQKIKGRPVRLLPTSDASFGKCIGHTPGIDYPSFGPWNMPSFVHKSSIYNECFDHNSKIQMKRINGTLVNICHYHPLGPYWRNLFCEATNIAGVQTQLSGQYCNDALWYGDAAR